MPRLTCKQLILGVCRGVEIFSAELDKPHLHPRSERADMSGWTAGASQISYFFWRKGHQIMCASKFQLCPRYFQGDAITAAGLPGGVGLEGHRAVEEIDRLEKGTLSHLSFVFPIRGLQCCPVVGDNIIKHDRLPSL